MPHKHKHARVEGGGGRRGEERRQDDRKSCISNRLQSRRRDTSRGFYMAGECLSDKKKRSACARLSTQSPPPVNMPVICKQEFTGDCKRMHQIFDGIAAMGSPDASPP